tara:strand:- start:10753 stop:11283 length:531 start_codon:yes stop_codon:yes gene_type:complete
MRDFKDDEGRPWQIALTVASALRIKQNVNITVDGKEVPFDIVDVQNLSIAMQVLRGNYAALAESIYYICIAQADKKNIDKEQFLEGMRGDCLETAGKALEEELIDFFPLRLREMISLLSTKMTQAQDSLMKKAQEDIEQMDLEEVSGTQFTSAPESSDATPESGPTENSTSLEKAV